MPSTIVGTSQIRSGRCCRNWAARTARAIVRLLESRTTVFMHPEPDIQVPAGQCDRFRRSRAVDGEGRQQPAEKHDLGRQEDPHPQRRRFTLLFDVVELVREDRLVLRSRPTRLVVCARSSSQAMPSAASGE